MSVKTCPERQSNGSVDKRVFMLFADKKMIKGVTLVELLVAVAIASILILAAVAAFQTTTRTAAVGKAREHIYQNARVALDLMAKEIKNAYIDSRNRDLVFVSADGLAGRGNSILEYYESAPDTYTIISRGLGNAQTIHGVYTTKYLAFDATAFEFYADETFGPPIWSLLSVKAVKDISTLAPGPPDRLDFACFASNLPATDAIPKPIPRDQSRLCEVRYMVTTETFVDDLDNDHDWQADEEDDVPPVGAGLQELGDMIAVNLRRRDDFHPETGKILDLNLFHLRRAIETYVNKNPFSIYSYPIDIDPNPATIDLYPDDPYGRYPARNIADFTIANNGENIGSYIYDLQFEFYGRIAIALDSEGAPNTWGVGWGYQDVRGEDTGIIADNANDDGEGPLAVDFGTVYNQGAANPRRMLGNSTTWNSLPGAGGGTVDLTGGIFFVLPAGSDEFTEFDVQDPSNDVYRITDVISDTEIEIDRPYRGLTIESGSPRPYRIIEPTQANGILDRWGGSQVEDVGADGIADDPLDNLQDDGSSYGSPPIGVPSNVSDNDGIGNTEDGNGDEPSIGEGNQRLDSRVMGIWDSRSPDPRNPRRASELNGAPNGIDDDGDGQVDDFTGIYATPEANLTNDIDDDGDGETDDGPSSPYGHAEGDDDFDGHILRTNLDESSNPIDDDQDGYANDDDDDPDTLSGDPAARAEIDDPSTLSDETNDLIDTDDDNVADDRFYEPAGRPEGVDEPDEANPHDDSLPKAVRITIAVSDPAQTLEPVVLSTVVWLSTAR